MLIIRVTIQVTKKTRGSKMGEKDLTEKILCDVAERLENKGRLEGIQEGRNEGQNDLVKAIQFLRNGKSDAEILQTGIDEKTLALAKTIR